MCVLVLASTSSASASASYLTNHKIMIINEVNL